jgi:hypothetical protein
MFCNDSKRRQHSDSPALNRGLAMEDENASDISAQAHAADNDN